MKTAKYVFLILIAALALSAFSSSDDHAKHTPAHYEYAVRQAFTEGRWGAGKYMLDESWKDYGDLPVFQELMGWYEYHNKRYQNARYYLMKALAGDESNYHARSVLIENELKDKKWSSAIRYINEQLQYDAYNKTWWLKKIYAYRELNNNDEADKLVRRLYSIYPNDKSAKYEYEEMLRHQYKRSGVGTAKKVEITKELVGANPTEENYMAYVNSLLQEGSYSMAVDAAAAGATALKSFALIKKRVGILCEQNRYPEAMAYLDEWKSTMNSGQFQRLYTETQKDFAYKSEQYDPYIMHGKNYEKTHDQQSLKFLVNTSMSRGYWDDAVLYINDYMKSHGRTADMLYRQYMAYSRIGNGSAAEKCLAEVVELQPGNIDALDELCAIRYKRGVSAYESGDWKDAEADLKYAMEHSTDEAMASNAKRMLVDCDVHAGDFASAEALADSAQMRDINLVRSKDLMDSGDYAQAYEILKPYALELSDLDVCQMYATCSANIGRDSVDYIRDAHAKFPMDEYFASKYCGMEYDLGYAAYKENNYAAAMAHADSSMSVRQTEDNMLLKGLVYEKWHMYDSAYVYQKQYLKDYPQKAKGMQAKSMRNSLDLSYQQARPSSDDVLTSNVELEYSRKVDDRQSFSVDFGYVGRDKSDDDKDGMGIQIGGSYTRNFKNEWSGTGGFLYGTKYFPKLNVRIAADKTYPNDMVWSIGAQYRLLQPSEYSKKKSMVTLMSSLDIPIKEEFAVKPSVSAHSVAGKFYISGNAKFSYRPEPLSKTTVWATVGCGTAPMADIVDYGMPSSFDKLNVDFGLGCSYMLTKNLTLSGDGTWYTMYSAIKKAHVNMLYGRVALTLSF